MRILQLLSLVFLTASLASEAYGLSQRKLMIKELCDSPYLSSVVEAEYLSNPEISKAQFKVLKRIAGSKTPATICLPCDFSVSNCSDTRTELEKILQPQQQTCRPQPGSKWLVFLELDSNQPKYLTVVPHERLEPSSSDNLRKLREGLNERKKKFSLSLEDLIKQGFWNVRVWAASRDLSPGPLTLDSIYLTNRTRGELLKIPYLNSTIDPSRLILSMPVKKGEAISLLCTRAADGRAEPLTTLNSNIKEKDPLASAFKSILYGHPTEALSLMHKSTNTQDRGLSNLISGMAYSQLGDNKKAYYFFCKLASWQLPEDQIFKPDIESYSRSRLTHKEQQEIQFASGLEDDPRNDILHFLHAVRLDEEGNSQAATKEIEIALALKPEKLDYKRLSALLYAKMNGVINRQKALSAINSVLKENKQDKEMLILRNKLSNPVSR